MKLELNKPLFAKGDKFEDLGSLKEFCKNFGTCKVKMQDKSARRIALIIKSAQEVEIKVLCSIALSQIIREANKFPADFEHYRLLRITKTTGEKFIRVSQSMEFDVDDLLADPSASLDDLIA